MKKLLTILIAFFLISSFFVYVEIGNASGYSVHSPIKIDSNSDFINTAGNESWTGSGTEPDPYIIENYEIDGGGYDTCVYIGNTTIYFNMKNNKLYNSSSDGLLLNNVSNGLIYNNNISDNSYRGIFLNNSHHNEILGNNVTQNQRGIWFDYSDNNTIKDNNVLNSSSQGILFFGESHHNEIVGNEIDGNYIGILMSIWSRGNSCDNLIHHNTISNSGDYGIQMGYSSNRNIFHNNTIANNTDGGIYQYQVYNEFYDNVIENNLDGFQLRNSNWNIIKRNQITNNVEDGVWIWGSNNNTVEENHIANNTNIGVHLNQDSYQPRYNKIHNNTIRDNNDGIFERYGDHNSFIGNTLIQNGNGTVLWYQCLENTVRDNILINNTDYSIWIREQSNSNVIEGNDITEGSYGIYLQNSDDCDVIENKVNGCDVNGIQLYLSNHSYIYDNELWNINGSGDRAIYIRGFSDHNQLKGNNIHDNEYGISIRGIGGVPKYNTITNNHIHNNLDDGIYYHGCKLNKINDNVFYSNGRYGMSFLSSSETEIMNNRIHGGHTRGISFLDSYLNSKIEKNYIYDNIRGIYLDGSTNNTITHNTIHNNSDGVRLWSSSDYNIVQKNDFSDNGYGMYAYQSYNNSIYLNNFINSSNEHAMENTAHNYYNGTTLGNYWDDYGGDDANGDGIGDTPYNIGGFLSTDEYPLWDLYEDNIYWVEEGGTGDGRIEGSPAGNISYVLDNYDLDNCTVKVKAGTYDSNNENYPLNVDDYNLTIKSVSGSGVTTLMGSGAEDCFDISKSDVVIDGFTIDNFYEGVRVEDYGVSIVDNVSIINNVIGNTSVYGFYSITSEDILIENNLFYNSSGHNINIESLESSSIINNRFIDGSDGRLQIKTCSNNEITGNKFSNTYFGIYVSDNSEKNLFELNTFEYLTGWTFSVSTSINNTVEDNTITNCDDGINIFMEENSTFTGNTITDTDWFGIRIASSNNNTISNNIIDNSVNEGINLNKGDNNTVHHNTITNNNYGIILFRTSNNNIHNNTVNSNTQKGIRLDDSNSNNVKDNTAYGNGDGIILESGSTENTIKNNIANSNVNHGIHLTNAVNNLIGGNTANSNTFNGMSLVVSNNNTIIDNTLNLNQEHGMDLANSVNVSIIGNQLNSNGISDIILDNTGDIHLSQNIMIGGGLDIFGANLDAWNSHSIDSTNTVNGKQLVYWKDKNSGTIGSDVGQVILANTTNVIVEDQELSNCHRAVYLGYSDQNIISDNLFSYNDYGITLFYSENNTIRNNTIKNNSQNGIVIDLGDNNMVYHNNFINTTQHVEDYGDNTWHNGYPSGGNYWDNYNGHDRYKGPDQDMPGRDGIGDSAYTMYANDDLYPLMYPWPMDNTAPVVSDVRISDVTLDTASITWTTDDKCDSFVKYSTESDLSNSNTIYIDEYVTDHIINLTDLTPRATYYFEVASNNTVGDITIDDNSGNYYSFTTTEFTMPEITDLTTETPTTGDLFKFEVNVTEHSKINMVQLNYSIDGGSEHIDHLSFSDGSWSIEIDIPDDAYFVNYSFYVHYSDYESDQYLWTDTTNLDVQDNDSPAISIYIDSPIDAGDTSQFYSSGSSDNIGIVNYTWEIHELGILLYGEQQEYTFQDAGEYTVELTVSDAAGNTNTSTLDIIVDSTGDTGETDTDNDGIPDSEDDDDDGDGMNDDWEIEHGFDPKDPSDANEDSDDDGLTNKQEYDLESNPNDSDTDGDGIEDGEDENPLDAAEETGSNNLIYIGVILIVVIIIVAIFFIMKSKNKPSLDSEVLDEEEIEEEPSENYQDMEQENVQEDITSEEANMD